MHTYRCSSYMILVIHLQFLVMKYHLKKPHWQRGDLNLHRRYQSTALLSTRDGLGL